MYEKEKKERKARVKGKKKFREGKRVKNIRSGTKCRKKKGRE